MKEMQNMKKKPPPMKEKPMPFPMPKGGKKGGY